jgi:hypothetical protein
MVARKIQIEVLDHDGPKPCPLSWLDSFCMQSLTGCSGFDETLPFGDDLLEASFKGRPGSIANR